MVLALMFEFFELQADSPPSHWCFGHRSKSTTFCVSSLGGKHPHWEVSSLKRDLQQMRDEIVEMESELTHVKSAIRPGFMKRF